MTSSKLQHIVEFMSESEQDSFTQICDNQLKFIFVGDKFCKLLDLNYNEIVGKNLRTINSPLSVLSDKYLALHLPLIQGSVDNIEYFTFMKHKQQVFIARNSVNSIKDGQVVVGICIRTEMLDNISNLPHLKDCIANLKGNNYAIISKSKPDINDATQMEEFTELVLFLIALGKYDKEIAAFCTTALGIKYSVFAISKFITRKLFVKFNVESRNHLISKIISENILNKIPAIIFNNPKYYSELFD